MQETTLLVLASQQVQVRVASALQSAANALGYPDGCYIQQLDQADDLRLCIFDVDPWSVIAIDEASIVALQQAFDLNASQFDAEHPVQVCGYTLVAVPGFAECLDDDSEKRVAWHRMQVAAHPKNPLD